MKAWMGLEPMIFGLQDQRLATWPPRHWPLSWSAFSVLYFNNVKWGKGDSLPIISALGSRDNAVENTTVFWLRKSRGAGIAKSRLWLDSNPQPLNVFHLKPRSPMRYPLRHRARSRCLQIKVSKESSSHIQQDTMNLANHGYVEVRCDQFPQQTFKEDEFLEHHRSVPARFRAGDLSRVRRTW